MKLVLNVIREALPSANRLTAGDTSMVQRCIGFVCDVAHHFFTNVRGCLAIQSAEELLLALFRLGVEAGDSPTGGIAEKISGTWQQGLRVLLRWQGFQLADDSFLSNAATCVHVAVRNGAVDSVAGLERLCEIASNLRTIVTDYLVSTPVVDNSARCPNVDDLMRLMYVHFDPSLLTRWNTIPLIRFEMVFSSVNDSKVGETAAPGMIPRCVGIAAFTARLYSNNLAGVASSEAVKFDDGRSEDSGKDGETPPADAASDDVSRVENVNVDIVLDTALGLAICRAIMGGRPDSPQTAVGTGGSELVTIHRLLEMDFGSLVAHIPSAADREQLVVHAFDESLSNGGLWSLSLGILLQTFNEKQISSNYWALLGGLERVTPLGLSAISTLEVALPYLSYDDVLNIAEIQAALLLSCPTDCISQFGGLLII